MDACVPSPCLRRSSLPPSTDPAALTMPLQTPVDIERFDDYLDYVEQPMDLSTVSAKLAGGGYQRPAELQADVELIWSNCEQVRVDPWMLCMRAVA